MAEVRVFNPAAYTPRSFFAEYAGEKGGNSTMAHHRRHRNRRRRNPLGLSSGVVKDAGFNAVGAIASMFVAGQFNLSGWGAVAATAGAAVALKFGGKMVVGESGSEELLKGGLTATIIAALHQAGFAKNLGLGLYAPSWFAVPTTSDQYLRNYAPQMTAKRGAGTIYFPGPGGQLVPAALPAGVSGMGFHRFRSRYAGNY